MEGSRETMRNFRTLILALISQLCPVLAVAQESDIELARLDGVVPDLCQFGEMSVLGDADASIAQTDDGIAITLASIVDPETAEPIPYGLSIQFAAQCNFAHQVSIRSIFGGLLNDDGSGSDGFSNRSDYSVSARWADESFDYTTSGMRGEGIGVSVSGVRSGDFQIEINSVPTSTPLISGDYSDQIIIEVSGRP
ncbi:hypothetical protein [Ponticaulis profundi]|uniref:Spore coat protein U domain-containing protein n=1 Tax=Ponticaulis profundi TaxID=2665222 RepID=A0ABW1SDW5_9PROT